LRSNDKQDRPERDWLAALTAGDKAAWDTFVDRYAGVIHGTARRILGSTGMSADEIGDVVQDVFVRLCRDQFRLLRTFDPDRAGLATWVGVIARSVALDARRRLRKATVPLDELVVEPAVDPHQPRERLIVPPDLLTPRQRLVLAMICERDMDVADVAKVLGVGAQTVRSTRHKAIVRLRGHFTDENTD